MLQNASVHRNINLLIFKIVHSKFICIKMNLLFLKNLKTVLKKQCLISNVCIYKHMSGILYIKIFKAVIYFGGAVS